MDDKKPQITDREKYLDALNELSQLLELDAAREKDKLEEVKKRIAQLNE